MKKPIQLISFFIISGAYAALVLLGPTDPKSLQKYHITQVRAHLLSLTIVIPLLLIWSVTYYGYVKFRNYTNIIKNTPEGPAFEKLTMGLMTLTFSLPLNAFLNATGNYIISNHQNYTTFVTITRNYTTLILSLISLVFISLGAESLSRIVRKKTVTQTRTSAKPLGLIMMSSIYSWLVIARPAAGSSSGDVSYAMPNVLIISTIVIPYLYAWYRGTSAVFNTYFYVRNVKGQLYRRALRLVAAGIMSVILINILSQLLVTISPKISRLNLTPILTIIYILIALYALGYGLIASGAKKLTKIEEV